MTSNAFEVPAFPLLVTEIVFAVLLLVIVTLPLHCPAEKLPVVLGVIELVKSVIVAVPVKLVTKLFAASSARMVIVNDCPAT